MAKLSKADVQDRLAGMLDISKSQAGEFIDGLAELATKELQSNGEFVLHGLGKLEKRHRASRQGRNPATGETITIAAKNAVGFKAAKQLKDAVN